MKNRKRIGKILLFFLICLLAWQTKVCRAEAAGANISIKADNNKITKGDIFYLIITVESAEEMSGFEGYFSYNQSVMKYITGGTVSSGNDDEFSISDTNRKEGTTELKYSIQFKARRTGSSTISLKSPYGVYRAEDSSKMPVASNILNILVVKEDLEPTEENQTKKEDVPGEGTDVPTVSPDEEQNSDEDFGVEEIESSTTPEEETIESSDAHEEEEMVSSEMLSSEQSVSEKINFQESSTDNSLEDSSKDITTTVIIFLLIFAICLLAAIIIGLILMKKQSFEEEDNWSAEEIWEEDNKKEIPDEKTETSIELEESLEDIERRLEKKRYWLRK